MRNASKVFVEKSEGRNCNEGLDVAVRIIQKFILEKYNGVVRNLLSCFMRETTGELL
jgi:hypothetical protein